MTDQTTIEEEWSPEKRAAATQWLIEKRLEKIQKKVPPPVFEELAKAILLLLAPWEINV